MSVIVNNNLPAINTLNNLNNHQSPLAKSLAKLAQSMKINNSADDSDGYQIPETIREQIRSLDKENYNAQNGNAMMKVAENAVNNAFEILKPIKEKVAHVDLDVGDTNTEVNRADITQGITQSIQQIDDNALSTNNGNFLNNGSEPTLKLGLSGRSQTVKVADKTEAEAALKVIDSALQRALSVAANNQESELNFENFPTNPIDVPIIQLVQDMLNQALVAGNVYTNENVEVETQNLNLIGTNPNLISSDIVLI